MSGLDKLYEEQPSRAKKRTSIKAQLDKLKKERDESLANERQQRELAKEERAKGDAIYWPIYNLDLKNPNSAQDLEHLPPQQLVENILQKEQDITAIMMKIKQALIGGQSE